MGRKAEPVPPSHTVALTLSLYPAAPPLCFSRSPSTQPPHLSASHALHLTSRPTSLLNALPLPSRPTSLHLTLSLSGVREAAAAAALLAKEHAERKAREAVAEAAAVKQAAAAREAEAAQASPEHNSCSPRRLHDGVSRNASYQSGIDFRCPHSNRSLKALT